MRRNLLALSVFIILAGLVLNGVSQISIQEQAPYETWLNVNDNEANPPVGVLSVEGNLTEGDKLRLWYSLQQSTNYAPNDIGIEMNLTDPNGSVKSYQLHVDITPDGKIETLDPYPVETVDYNGTYRVDAQSHGVVLIRLLIIQKALWVEPELKHPYTSLAPVGIVVLSVGAGVALWSAVSTKRKRVQRKETRPKS